MPLTDQEKYVLSDFLNKMDNTVLCRLGASVTQGTINPTNKEDAFNCIMLHTESLYQLLNLKRVSITVLMKYLHQLNEPVPGTASKEEMLQILYQKWNLPYPSHSIRYTAPPMSTNNGCMFPNSQTMVANHPPALTQVSNQHAQPNHQFQMMIEAVQMLGAGTNRDPLSQMVRSKQVLKEMNTMAFNEYVVGFAKTFYNLLNTPGGQWLHSFNNEHFFEDCKLKVMIKGGSEDIEMEGEGIHNVFSVLSELRKEHQLYFSPNLMEQGIRSKQDSHGLVSAAVCGTLHQRSGPVGVFEQCFILSSDPFARESYKILETVLILRSSNGVSSMTQLMLTSAKRDNDVVAPLAVESTTKLAITDVQ